MKEIYIDELCVTEKSAYGLNYECSMIVEFNPDSYKAIWAALVMSGETRLMFNRMSEMYRHLEIVGDDAYLIEHCSNRVVKINLVTRKQKIITLGIRAEVLHIIGYQKDVLYIFAVTTATIVAVNILSEAVSCYKLPDKYVGKINSGEMKLCNGSILITGYMHNQILRFDCQTGKIEEHIFENMQGDICLCENARYLICITQKEVYFWDINFKCIKKKLMLPEDTFTDENSMPFYKSIIVENKLILLPIHAIGILQIDLKSFDMQYISVMSEKKSSGRMKNFDYWYRSGAYLYGLDSRGDAAAINHKTGELTRIIFYMPDGMLNEIKKQIVSLPSHIMVEGRQFSILEILKYDNKEIEKKEEFGVGEKIYRIC